MPNKNILLDLLTTLASDPTLNADLIKEAYAYAVLQDKALAELTLNGVKAQLALDAMRVELVAAESLIRQHDAVTLDLGPFGRKCHANSVAHGWHDKDKSFGDNIALMHSELSEALEAFREPLPFAQRLFHLVPEFQATPDEPQKPDGILPELADVIIRILDYTESIHATSQLILSLKLKHEYNKTRAFRHGGKLL